MNTLFSYCFRNTQQCKTNKPKTWGSSITRWLLIELRSPPSCSINLQKQCPPRLHSISEDSSLLSRNSTRTFRWRDWWTRCFRSMRLRRATRKKSKAKITSKIGCQGISRGQKSFTGIPSSSIYAGISNGRSKRPKST